MANHYMRVESTPSVNLAPDGASEFQVRNRDAAFRVQVPLVRWRAFSAKCLSRNGAFAPRRRIDPPQSRIQVEIERRRPYRIGCPGTLAFPAGQGFICLPDAEQAAFLVFWLFH